MEYTIGEVSKMFDLPVSTLRYYDRQGLLRDLKRTSGIRKFDEKSIEAIRVIECLKKSGLEISAIAKFMDLCEGGAQTYGDRRELFSEREKDITRQLEELKKTQAMLQFKIWYYTIAIEDGNEDRIHQMIDSHSLPESIQEMYDLAHS